MFTGFPDFTYSHFVFGGCLSALSLLEGEDRTEVRLRDLHPPYIRARGQHRRGPRSRSPDFLHVPLALEEPESRLSPRSRPRDPRLRAVRLREDGAGGACTATGGPERGLYSHGREPVQATYSLALGGHPGPGCTGGQGPYFVLVTQGWHLSIEEYCFRAIRCMSGSS